MIARGANEERREGGMKGKARRRRNKNGRKDKQTKKKGKNGKDGTNNGGKETGKVRRSEGGREAAEESKGSA